MLFRAPIHSGSLPFYIMVYVATPSAKSCQILEIRKVHLNNTSQTFGGGGEGGGHSKCACMFAPSQNSSLPALVLWFLLLCKKDSGSWSQQIQVSCWWIFVRTKCIWLVQTEHQHMKSRLEVSCLTISHLEVPCIKIQANA